MTTENQELSLQIKTLAAEKAQMTHQLTLFEKDSLEIQSKVKRGVEAQQESSEAQRTIANLRDKERDLTRQLEQQMIQNDLKQSDNERLQSKVTTTAAYCKSLESDL